VIEGVHHVDRGYEDLVGKLRSVGADIVREDTSGEAPDGSG
jgi:UDP-N-acetylglucosamine 1-carboxyvinyltransferase